LLAKAGHGIRCVGYIDGDDKVYTHTHYVVGGRWGMKKITVGSTGGEAGKQVASLASTVWSKHAALVRFCASLAYDDGTPRQPGWIVIKTLGPCWVVELKDPDSGAKLVCVEPVLDDALTSASMLLEAPEAPWEVDPWLSSRKPRRKGK